MKRLIWINSNKCQMDTGFKRFDKQCTLITTGNTYSDTQRSWYIRPYNACECNGQTFEPGYLLEKDLEALGKISNMQKLPYFIEKQVYDKKRTESICLYVFGTYRDGRFNAFGIVLTDKCDKLIDYMVVGHNHLNKYVDAIKVIIPYITNEGTTEVPKSVLNELKAQLALDPYCMATTSHLGEDMIERTYRMRFFWKDVNDGWIKDNSPYITIKSGYHTEDVVRLSDVKTA